MVSANGPQLIFIKFSVFMSKNGVKHTLVSQCHPQSNVAAERSVRVVKEALVKQVLEGNRAWSLKHMLDDFLLRSRTTPHSTTGISPAELLMKHRLRTRLSLDFKNHWERQFFENDTVRVRPLPHKQCCSVIPGIFRYK